MPSASVRRSHRLEERKTAQVITTAGLLRARFERNYRVARFGQGREGEAGVESVAGHRPRGRGCGRRRGGVVEQDAGDEFAAAKLVADVGCDRLGEADQTRAGVDDQVETLKKDT